MAALLSACAATNSTVEEHSSATIPPEEVDKLLVVDCLLPGQIRKLGTSFTYLTPRRPIKTSASDCEIRGGEYVAYDRSNYATALRVWLPQAQAGDPMAQTYVGEIYERGLGLEPDYGLAIQWYRKAAEQGYSRAQINLGSLYEQGLGVPKDPVTALNWYRKASGLTDDQLAFTSSISTLEAERDTLRAERDTLRVERASLATERGTLRKERDSLRTELVLREQEANLLRAQLEQTQQQLQARRTRLEATQQELEKIQRQLAQHRGTATTARPSSAATETVQQLEKRLTKQQELLEQQHQEIAYLQQEADRQQAQLKAELRAAKQQTQDLEQDVAAQTRERESLQQQVTYLQGQLFQYQDRLNTSKAELETEHRQLEQAEQDLKKQLAAATQNTSEMQRLQQQLEEKNQQLMQTQQRVNDLEVEVNRRQSELEQLQALREEQTILTSRAGNTRITELQSSPRKSLPNLDFGRYNALIIGNNRYAHFPNLATAVNDAQAMAQLLKAQYGFQTQVLTDANRYAILSALEEFRSNLTEQDNFLLYYAGHGELDRTNGRGNWLPVDAEPDSRANWISNVAITDILNSMSAKHIMVIADSCYSGTMARAITTSLEGGRSEEKRIKWLKLMIDTRSRTVMTSGGLKPVLDSGGGDHSIFANVLFDVLQSNDDILEGPILYQQVAKQVKAAATRLNVDQDPRYAPMQFAGDLGAPFFFVPKTGATTADRSSHRYLARYTP